MASGDMRYATNERIVEQNTGEDTGMDGLSGGRKYRLRYLRSSRSRERSQSAQGDSFGTVTEGAKN